MISHEDENLANLLEEVDDDDDEGQYNIRNKNNNNNNNNKNYNGNQNEIENVNANYDDEEIDPMGPPQDYVGEGIANHNTPFRRGSFATISAQDYIGVL